jgi:hypothetical protein
MIERLKYVSRFARPLGLDEVRAIVETSSRNNAEAGLSGVLLVNNGVFMQILEGPTGPLEATFERIGADDRHRDLVVVRRTHSPSRLFGDWSMRMLGISATPPRELRPVLELIEACARGSSDATRHLYALDDALWRALDESSARGRSGAATRAHA